MSTTTRRVGRRRWAKLTKFLENTMTSAGSERTRMQAAMRLTDVLLAREQREIAELRAAARMAEKAETDTTETVTTSEPEPHTETAEEAARKFLETVRRAV